MATEKTHFVYIIYSKKIDKLYIGTTSNLEHRLKQHNSNQSNYTKNKGEWVLLYYETFQSKTEALKREKQIKAWKSRKYILKKFNLKLPE